DWPGNVRQLGNEIDRIVTFSASEPAPLLDVADLSEAVLSAPSGDLHDVAGVLEGISLNGGGLDNILSRAEKAVIEKVLERNDGQVASAAEALGLTRQGLYKKMKRLGIESSQFQPAT
ncbi:MAG: helix-turn-helix domain-containing protein, partial [Rhodothermales bacterium]